MELSVTKKVNVYISKQLETVSPGLLISLSKAIMTQSLFRDSRYLDVNLYALLSSPVEQIMETFAKFNIPLYGSHGSKTSTTVPSPGDFVPQAYASQLLNNNARLSAGDYAAYLVDDAFHDVSSPSVSRTSDATYAYARVVRVVRPHGDEDDVPTKFYKYEIEVGKAGTKIVASTSLYRFNWTQENRV